VDIEISLQAHDRWF